MLWMWVVIVAVLALVISPIVSLMPNQHQRASARLRTHAAKIGLRVRLADLSPTKAKHSGETYPVYGLPWLNADDTKLGKKAPWFLVKVKYAHDIHAYKDWDWASPDLKGDNHWRRAIQALFEQAQSDPLYERLEGLEWNAQGVQVYWRESDQEQDVDRLATVLQELKAFGRDQFHQPTWPPVT